MKGELAKRRSRTEPELRQASTKLAYEIGMLTGTLRELPHVGDALSNDSQRRVVHNALIHAFLMFVRNVHSFLFIQPRLPEDLVASDFFDEPAEWTTARPDDPLADSPWREIINYRVAHLSWKRLECDPPDWPMDQLAAVLCGPLRLFSEIVDDAKVDPQLRSRISELGEAVGEVRS